VDYAGKYGNFFGNIGDGLVGVDRFEKDESGRYSQRDAEDVGSLRIVLVQIILRTWVTGPLWGHFHFDSLVFEVRCKIFDFFSQLLLGIGELLDSH